MDHPPRRARGLLAALAVAAALSLSCDEAGGESGRQPAQPPLAPPVLSPTELLPPRVDRSTVDRVEVRPPPSTAFIQVDSLLQSEGMVDILWVIDDSGSMANQRQTLGSNFQRFFDRLVELKVNFQIGVISTNSNDGGVLRGATRIITNTTPDPETVFITNTTFPPSRARWEEALRMMQIALSPPVVNNQNAGFVRPAAALAVIAVSDEDDGSIGNPPFYARFLRSAKGKGNENLVTFSVIGGTTPNGCYPPGEQIYFGGLAEPAFRYSEVANQTNGIIGSICDSTFENTLIRIAEALNTLRRTFPLSLEPNPSTITVLVNGALVPKDPFVGWQYQSDTRSITFLGTYVPPPGASIRISYAVKP
ncbi:MAG TPA: VWA domain-containing protein [Myxococcales bacterium]|jgi:hypothetical protein|nr:VWA domain-containing protein [Myxococcales bacterium]